MKILGAGDNVIDRYRRLGVGYPGGNAVNVAVFASRLGARAAYMGVLGDDEGGRHLKRALEVEGVSTDLTEVAHGHNAYAEVEIVDTDRVFVGSDRSVQPFDLNQSQLKAMANFDTVHTAYTGSLRSNIPEMAGQSKVSFDFGSRFTLKESVELAQHLFLASFSTNHLSREESLELVEAMLERGTKNVIATRGGEGAYLGTPEGVLFQKAERVAVIDTLGAGDAFIASVLVGLLSGRDAKTVAASASAHAAQVCLIHGAFGHPISYHPVSETDPKVVNS
ncbi:PfkB family carbohydrate kinase [Nesterenkonia sp.]|uniref:PfkB family carbohydrate kinase n=1 Tax=Nesterenkonia sp. TaxID=704201 RepID=UPI00260E5328|nr:PfkB family carbohydrate kinase [Nesterenkonia sp.]